MNRDNIKVGMEKKKTKQIENDSNKIVQVRNAIVD